MAQGASQSRTRLRVRTNSSRILGIRAAVLLCLRHFESDARFACDASIAGCRWQLPKLQQNGERGRSTHCDQLRRLRAVPGAAKVKQLKSVKLDSNQTPSEVMRECQNAS